MKKAYCTEGLCIGEIIPYIDMRDGKLHCNKCGKSYTIVEFYEIFRCE